MRKSLYDWCQENGEYGQYILNNWTGIEVDKDNLELINSNISIKDVTYGSLRKFKFICDKGHTYYKSIWHTTNPKQKCTICSMNESSKYVSSSYAEQLMFNLFKQIYNRVYNRYILNYNRNRYEYDIYIDDLKLCIEYSPMYWHREKIDRSFLKRDIAISNKLHYFEIFDDSYNEYNETFTEECLIKKINYNKIDDEVLQIIKYILGIFDSEDKIRDIDIKKAKIEANKYAFSVLDGRDLKSNYMLLYEEANNDINIKNGINIDKLYATSSKRINFVCKKCGYGSDGCWENSLASRVSGKTGCPSCGYNWFTNEIKHNSIKKIDSRLLIRNVYPNLINEATEDISNLSINSNKNIAWVCSKCKYKWNTTIYSRCNRKSSCLKCGYSILTDSYKNVKNIQTSFLEDFPNLINEISKTFNNNDIIHEKRNSDKEVYWECSKCGFGSLGEWKSKISSRTSKKSGCKSCGWNSFYEL